MSRRSARENLLKLVYEFVITQEKNPLTYNLITQNMENDDISYVEKLYFGVTGNYDDLVSRIDKYAIAFTTSRIFKVDLAIMLVSAYEILNCDDIPFQVSINEALELSKIYSTEKSTSFINGVLSKIVLEKETK